MQHSFTLFFQYTETNLPLLSTTLLVPAKNCHGFVVKSKATGLSC